MRKLMLILSIFISIVVYAKKSNIVEDIPWQYEYSINKYGEKDKIIGLSCGKYGMRENIMILKNGIEINISSYDYDLTLEIDKISFLFDSKKEIIVEKEIEDKSREIYSRERSFFINDKNYKYQEILNNIKNSRKMSILLQDKKGNNYKIVDIDNRKVKNMIKKI